MAEKLNKSFNFTEDQQNKLDSILSQLKQEFPESFEDGRINFDTLSQLMGNEKVVNPDEKEHFGLSWPGKAEARRFTAKPPQGTLRPMLGEGINEDTTENIFIEGENLEVLKIIRKSYGGKIKMIYIDPPYNTGKDFIYSDNFTEGLEDYLRKTGQKSEEGVLTSNPKSQGRYHTNWLNFMYPRLRIAKDLLKDDGVVFVSIDDNEVHNLRELMNEIFGEENFLAQLVWNTEGNTDNQLEIKVNHEYIILYLKNNLFKNEAIGKIIDPNTPEDSNLRSGFADNNVNKNNKANPPQKIILPKGFPSDCEEFSFNKDIVDNYFFEKTNSEKVISKEIVEEYSIRRLPVLLNDMEVKDGRLVNACEIFVGFSSPGKLKEFIENDCKPIYEDSEKLYFYLNRNGCVRYRRERAKARNILSVLRNLGTTEKMKSELKRRGIYFDYPKPVELIKYIIQIGCDSENDIILDFFGGSATLGDAVYEANIIDDLKRSFICIQIDEEISKDNEAYNHGFKTVSQMAKKRLKNKFENLEIKLYDSGFKVFKLDRTNIKEWQDIEQHEGVAEINNQIDMFITNPLVEDAKPQDVIAELYLNEGFPLHS